ncbi:MAG: hypothetical protein GY696_33315 [Gammaproteobacteria bacterium]|nr:hypothetical protein [Gammaproteobacteria bacterium]
MSSQCRPEIAANEKSTPLRSRHRSSDNHASHGWHPNMTQRLKTKTKARQHHTLLVAGMEQALNTKTC